MADYVRASGDVAFLTAQRTAIEKAWAFETDPAHDTDHDGIYDNSQGTGWVEGWPGAMPHQEIYLALLVQQSAEAMSYIENLLGDRTKSGLAKKSALSMAMTIEKEYYDAEKGCYDFSRDVAKDGSIAMDRTVTVYPAMAWWDPEGGKSILAHPDKCLGQLAGHALNTDWGLRDVANDEKIYDGLSYHQGSVWPLFTGWAAMAEFRGGQPLAGYQMLMENANLTKAQDLGSVTELLSGDYFVPFGRSTSHQLWSSAMVITPVLRGLFGISIDAQTKTITVNPRLPAGWDHAEIQALPLHGATGPQNLIFERHGTMLEVAFGDSAAAREWRMRSDLPGVTFGAVATGRMPGSGGLKGLRIPLLALEVDETLAGEPAVIEQSAAVMAVPPVPGARNSRFRVLSSHAEGRKLVLSVEGLAGTTGYLRLVRHGRFVPKVQAEPPVAAGTEEATAEVSVVLDAEQDATVPILLHLHFPPGEGWKTVTVTLTW